jgi:hypothetical protein
LIKIISKKMKSSKGHMVENKFLLVTLQPYDIVWLTARG